MKKIFVPKNLFLACALAFITAYWMPAVIAAGASLAPEDISKLSAADYEAAYNT